MMNRVDETVHGQPGERQHGDANVGRDEKEDAHLIGRCLIWTSSRQQLARHHAVPETKTREVLSADLVADRMVELMPLKRLDCCSVDIVAEGTADKLSKLRKH